MLQALFILAVCAVVVMWPRIELARSWRIAALICIVIAGLTHQLSYNVIAEDAFISFRYAHHLAAGQGFVFNPGERVEGYSNFLLTLFLAVLNKLFGWDIPTTGRALGIIFASCEIVAVFHVTRLLTGRTSYGLLAALLLAGSSSFAAYGPSGLEAPLFGLLVLAVVYCAVVRRWRWAGVAVSVATMTRPEGVLLALPCLGFILRTSRPHDRLRHALEVVAPMCAILLPWTAWRYWYYGHVLPNPIAAKMGMEMTRQLVDGALYVISYAITNAPTVMLFTIVAWTTMARRRSERANDAHLFLAATFVMLMGFAVLVGGDWMPAWRFIAPAVPLACVLMVCLWHGRVAPNYPSVSVVLVVTCAVAGVLLCGAVVLRLRPLEWVPSLDLKATTAIVLGCGALIIGWWKRMAHDRMAAGDSTLLAAVVAIAVISFGVSFIHPNLIPRFEVWRQQITDLSNIGQWFGRALPADTPVAVLANGADSYYSDLPTIDVLGLTDEHIARQGLKDAGSWPGHGAYDYVYVASRKPAIIYLSGVGFESSPRFTSRPEFKSEYEPISLSVDKHKDRRPEYLNILVLRREQQAIVGRLLEESRARLVLR